MTFEIFILFIFFGGREATTGNASAVRGLREFGEHFVYCGYSTTIRPPATHLSSREVIITIGVHRILDIQ